MVQTAATANNMPENSQAIFKSNRIRKTGRVVCFCSCFVGFSTLFTSEVWKYNANKTSVATSWIREEMYQVRQISSHWNRVLIPCTSWLILRYWTYWIAQRVYTFTPSMLSSPASRFASTICLTPHWSRFDWRAGERGGGGLTSMWPDTWKTIPRWPRKFMYHFSFAVLNSIFLDPIWNFYMQAQFITFDRIIILLP